MVEIPPTVFPDFAAPRALSLVVAGDEKLEGLGEARFPGSVAADDEGQTKAGGELELYLGANATKAFDGDRLDVRADWIRGFCGLGNGFRWRVTAEAFFDFVEERGESQLLYLGGERRVGSSRSMTSEIRVPWAMF